MLKYTVWYKNDLVGTYDTYKEAKTMVNNQFYQYGLKLVIHRLYI